MYNELYLVLDIISACVVIFLFFRTLKNSGKNNRIYLYALISALAIMAFGSIKLIINMIEINIEPILYNTLSAFHFSAGCLMPVFWFIYLEKLKESRLTDKLFKIIIFIVPTMVCILIVIITLLLSYFKLVDYDLVYDDGKYYYIEIILAFLYMGLTAILSLKKMRNEHNKKEKNDYLTISSLALYPLILGLIQIFIPLSNFLNIGLIIGLFQTFIYIESLDSKKDLYLSKVIGFGKLFKITYFANIKDNRCERLIDDNSMDNNTLFDQTYDSSYLESTSNYINKYVANDDKERVMLYLSPSYIKENLSDEEPFYTFIYKQEYNGIQKYFRMYVILQPSLDDEVSNILISVMDVDQEVRKDIKQRNLIEETLLEVQKANNAKSSFLSNISHEMRTPMNAILGYATLANMYIDDKDKLKDYLSKINSSGNHLLDLINNVLDLNRIESGKTEISEKSCDLNIIIGEVSKILQNSINNKSIDFTIENTITNSLVKSDKLKLSEIMMNLVNNSIKYTPNNGTISFKLEEYVIDTEKSNYRLTVEDSGIGIEKEFLKVIFEPFEREKNTTESGVEGSGLGLAITKRFIDLMGGTITVESELGKGSIFIVDLPLKLDIVYEEEVLLNDTANPSSGSRLLVVEDNDLNYEIIYEILTNSGYIIERATNGLDSVNKVKYSISGYYDLILMDIQMPVMNGYDATKKIRSLEDKSLKNIPIIAMTADAFDKDIKRALDVGMNAHVSKPIEFDKLIKTINTVLSRN